MEPSDALKAIQLAIVYIKDDNIEGLGKVLDIMPLDQLREESDVLLSTFLSVCAGYDRPDAARLVLEAWKVIYPEGEQIQLKSRLFMMNEINVPTLAFVALMDKDYTYIELMDDLMAADNSEEVVSACSKADQVFGTQPYSTYDIVRQHSEELGNWRVEGYAIASMEEIAPYAPKPEWVQNYTKGPLLPESELYVPETGEVPFELPTDDEAVEMLTKGLTQLGISVDDLNMAEDTLRQRLSISTRAEKIGLLKPIMENQAQEIMGGDLALFRLFGPANPLVNQDLTRPGKSNMYGGCRMFLCDVFDYDEEDHYVKDWFDGVCGICHLRIPHHWYAVRKPRDHGGWIGCYCSWECVRNSILEYEEEPDLLAHELINIFEREIYDKGIQDRLPNK
jgi:hypothetical protein